MIWSLQFDPHSAFRSTWLQWHSGRGDAAPAPDSAQQLQLYLAPASKNRCEVLGGELIFISTQRELWTQTLKQATNDDWQGGIFTVRNASKFICTDSKYSTPRHLPPRVAAAETLCWSKFWSVFLFKMHNISPPPSPLQLCFVGQR